MTTFFLAAGIFLALLLGLALSRAVMGPTLIDRIVGVNVVGTKTTVLIIVIGTIFDRVDMFVDIGLGYALLNFIASIAASKYLQRYRSMHPEEESYRSEPSEA
jgi:multicomponent Na+:H+ antiporter subunit F